MNILDQFSLQGKVALVTGGAGKFGRQIVAAVAGAGAKTFVAARSLDATEALAAEYRDQGWDVTALQYDQADESSILRLRDAILEQAGKIDILVNNSVLRSMQHGYRDDAAAFAKSMDVNATGLFVMTRAFGDAMAEKGSGSIINIGSIHGMIGPDESLYRGTNITGWYPDYFFHKGGMINFTRFTASYYGPKGVRCNCVSPGGFFSGQDETFVKQYGDRTFLGRLADDEDLKGIIVLLGSDASRYITGTNIPVDGGYTAK
jgi:NAD(P)-dependent dehydrogenase (short-subunit alcohol dehydrogenase family)